MKNSLQYNFSIVPGTDVSIPISEIDVNNQIVDMTNYNFQLSVMKDSFKGETVLDLTTLNGKILVSTEGLIIKFNAEDTEEFLLGDYYYKLKRTDAGYKRSYLIGIIKFVEG